jgi:ferredoxin-NADP reductase
MTDTQMDLAIRSMDKEADDVLGLTLGRPDNGSLPEWSPGAHLELVLKPGLVRQYSLCGDPADRSNYRIAVLLEKRGRGGSEHVHSKLQEGDVLHVRGPRNHFRLVEATRYIFVAGGIGITPILPMVREVASRASDFSVLYGGRRKTSMAFVDQLAQFGPRVRIVPEDREGRLDLTAALTEMGSDTKVYCCGPEGLISAVEQICAQFDPDSLHVERFAARTTDSGQVTNARGVRVLLARSDLEVTVPPDRSILDVVLEAGVDIPYDCMEGICGSCEVDVLEGEIDHRDEVLTKWEKESNKVMMICCSRARSERIVLNL